MDENKQYDQDKDEYENGEQAIPADRGMPSVAIQPRGQSVLIAGVLALALLAMIWVIMDGRHKNAPQSLIEHEEVVFRTAGGATAPYIAAEPVKAAPLPVYAPAPPDQNNDPAAMQREQVLQEEALRIAREQQQKMKQRLHSPQLVFDQPSHKAPANTQNITGASSYGSASLPTGGSTNPDNNNPDSAFANQYAGQDVETVQARQLQNLHALVPQGTMIAGILETAIQSSLPGMVRAIVSENVYSFDGSHLLISKGSRLIGRYRSGVVRGQSRVFVIWNRLIRNDGVSINIDSSGTDDLGRAGLDGFTDTHFMERFGSSVLLSLIDTGLQIGAQSFDKKNTSTVALETGSDFSRSAEIALENSIAIPPTIHVDQGKRIKVFVGKDLDFSKVAGNIPR